jgi:3-oxoacyl-[acyl-carrier-protein] synthase-3
MVYLHGIGHFHPENTIDNSFLANLDIGVDEKWVLERVGIHERRTVLSLDYISKTRNQDPRAAREASDYNNAQTGAIAALRAISRAGIEASDIGMVIAGGCSPQYSIPSEACMIAAEIGIEVPAIDLNAACSSFAMQLHFINSMRAEATPDFILLVNSENNTRTIDYSDRTTAVLWGDGTVASVVSNKISSSAEIKFSTYNSNPFGWNKVLIPNGRHFWQDGAAVQTFAIKRTVETIIKLRESTVNHPENFFFIGHQANLRMLQSVCNRVDINADRHLFNVDHFGNCGAAGAPSVLSENWDSFQSGDELALAVVGSGLAWGDSYYTLQNTAKLNLKVCNLVYKNVFLGD